MGERGRGRFDRSQYGSHASQSRQDGDDFYSRLRLDDEDVDRIYGVNSDAEATDEFQAQVARHSRSRYTTAARQREAEANAGGRANAASDAATAAADAVAAAENSRRSRRRSARGSSRSTRTSAGTTGPIGTTRTSAGSTGPIGRVGAGASDAPGIPVDSVTTYSATAATRPNSRGRGFKIAIIALIAAVLIGAGAAFAYITTISNNLHEGIDQDLRNALVHTDMANEPFYMLLLGTDKSNWRDVTGELDGVYRSDSMMLARIDAPNKKVTLISIGRDITVDLGEGRGEQKINAAYAFGGPALAVEAVSKLAGVPISHYAEVNFDGFRSIVDALGGIEVEVPIDIDDVDAGGSVSAGKQTLTGDQALILCRSRNAYADTAARPDDMRTANQRLVLSAIAKKLLAADIATIANTVRAMSEYVMTDLEVNDIIGLAQAMRGLDSDTDIYTASVPAQTSIIDGGYYDYVKKSEWDAMMKRVKAGEPPTEGAQVDEVTGTVMATAGSGTALSGERYATVAVRNCTDTDGLGASVRRKLMDAGYVNVTLGEATPGYDYPETLVLYDEPGRAREAADIVSIMGQGKAMENDGSYLLADNDLMVIIGDDWKQ